MSPTNALHTGSDRSSTQPCIMIPNRNYQQPLGHLILSSDIKNLVSSNINDLKCQIDRLKVLEASHSHLHKRFEMQSQGCQQVMEEEKHTLNHRQPPREPSPFCVQSISFDDLHTDHRAANLLHFPLTNTWISLL